MIRSMTGFGRGESRADHRKFTVEIRSVNHRYSDINIKLSRTMAFLEEKIRNYVKEKVARGKVDIYINFESEAKEDITLQLNTSLADIYKHTLDKIQERYKLDVGATLPMIANFPDVITVEQTIGNETWLWDLLYPALKQAVDEFMVMREKEGNLLKNNILAKLEIIQSIVEKVKIRSPIVINEYKQKLEMRLKELLPDHSIDNHRFVMEVSLFADRCSIDEEIVRLESHIIQMKDILHTEEVVGRKLDFLAQEMNREANTIASKANDIVITKGAIELKNEIEKVREQIQNIE
ncbi:MAG: YicC family protein [Epulopiscium sp.]|nr:YicC family protein [Candidatus Epulonipiscium sp.]